MLPEEGEHAPPEREMEVIDGMSDTPDESVIEDSVGAKRARPDDEMAGVAFTTLPHALHQQVQQQLPAANYGGAFMQSPMGIPPPGYGYGGAPSHGPYWGQEPAFGAYNAPHGLQGLQNTSYSTYQTTKAPCGVTPSGKGGKEFETEQFKN